MADANDDKNLNIAAGSRKVLMLVENLSYPFDQRVRREALALHEAGYRVSVISPKGKAFDTESRDRVDGISVYRYKAFEASDGLAAYLFEFGQALVMMSLLALRVLRREGFDVIHLCNPPDLLFLVALPYKLFGKKVVFDHHDLAPETYQTKKETEESNAVHKALLFFERQTFRAADVLISTNESYREIALDRGEVAPENAFVVRNGPDAQRMREMPPNPELKEGKSFLLYYLGMMGEQDGVDYMLRALQCLTRDHGRKDFLLLAMGGGPQLERMRGLARDLGIADHVRFTGLVRDPDRISEALNTADVCLCPDPPMPLNSVSTMMKTLEYMALGKPVVSFDLKETRVSAGNAALYAEGNDVRDFAAKIDQLLGDPALRGRLGAIGKKRIAEGLSWQHQKIQLLRAYDRAFNRID